MTLTEQRGMTFLAGLDFPVVLADTSEMTREEWLELRKQGLGGSDAAWVMGRSRYKSPYTGWAEKAGFIEEPNLDDRESVEWGHRLEPIVAERFSERFGLEIIDAPVMLQHPTYPWMLANVDRFIVEGGEIVGILEVKTAGLRMADYWEGDDVPDHYWLQVQHYLACCGLDFAYLTVLIGGQEQRDYRIERDELAIADLIAKEGDMWAHVEAKIAPDVDGSESTKDTLGEMWIPEEGSVTDLPDEAIDLIVGLAALAEKRKEIEAEETLGQNELKALLAEHEIGRVNGEVVVTWKPQTRKTIDSKRLKAEHPEIAAEYEKASTFRKLDPKYSKVLS